MMKNSGIFKKIILQEFRQNFRRFSSVQHVYKNYSTASHKTNFIYLNKIQTPCLTLFNQHSRKTLCCAPAPLYINFHRNLTNEALFNNKPDEETTPNVPVSDDIVEEGAKIEFLLDGPATDWAREILLEIHDLSGLPWWASIALTAFFVRTVISLPFAIAQTYHMGKMRLIDKRMETTKKDLQDQLNKAFDKYNLPEETMKDKYNKLVKGEFENQLTELKCATTFKYYLPIMQCLSWLSFTYALRKLCVIPVDVNELDIYEQLMVGGFGWITDLTEIDPQMILPAATALIYFTIIEVHLLFRVNNELKKQENIRLHTYRLLATILLCTGVFMPTAVNIYWFSSSLYGLMQAFLLNSMPVKRLFKVVIPYPEEKQPYRLFYNNLRLQLGFNKEKEIIEKQILKQIEAGKKPLKRLK